ncbi:MAG: heavy metal-associated domain-containing protein, partial [Longimicrobiales bacterium]|nr:heavy metal-associated domain-containing protein [Longimicrobiales bacterium]
MPTPPAGAPADAPDDAPAEAPDAPRADTPEPGHTTLTVEGMTCAACSSRVQRALEKREGVRAASVNLMLENAVIDFDPERLTPEELIAAIEAVGYGARLPETGASALDEQGEQDRAGEVEFRRLRTKAIVALLAAAVGMVISMPVMSSVAEGVSGGMAMADPFMRWSARVIDPAIEAVFPWLYTADLRVLQGVLLALTVGVMG